MIILYESEKKAIIDHLRKNGECTYEDIHWNALMRISIGMYYMKIMISSSLFLNL